MAERRNRRGRPPREVVPKPDDAPGGNPPSARHQREIDLLGRMRGQVARGRKVRRNWEDQYQIEALEAAYEECGESRHDFADIEEEPEISINRFLPTIMAQLPSLFFQMPTFMVDPVDKTPSEASVERARVGEALLQTVAAQDDQLENASELAILQSYFRMGVLKCCYEPKMEPNPHAGEPMYERDANDNRIIDETSGLERQAVDDEGKPMTEPREVLTDEVFAFRWVDACRMILPDDGPDPTKWRWIAEEITVPLDDAKDDPRFSADLRKQLVANTGESYDDPEEREIDVGSEPSTNLDPERTEDEFFTYIEYWDIKKKKRYMWAAGQPFSRFLFDDDFPPGIEDHPYCLLRFFKATGKKPKPYPIPLTAPWLELAREQNIRRNQEMNGARRTARKVFYQEGTFRDEQEAQKALQSNQDMQAVAVSDMQRMPQVIADQPPAGNIAQDRAMLGQEWVAMVGLPSSTYGQSLGSAREASIQQQTGDIRESHMRRTVSKWLAEAGRKMFGLLRANLTLEVWVKIRGFDAAEFGTWLDRRFGQGSAQSMVGNTNLRDTFLAQHGKKLWQAVTREDITFDAMITVAPGSAKSRTVDSERQQVLEFSRIIGQFPQLMQSRELMLLYSQLFEFVDQRVVDEFVALGEKMAALEAQKAGRYQGQDQGQAGQQAVDQASQGTNGAAPPQPPSGLLQSLMRM